MIKSPSLLLTVTLSLTLHILKAIDVDLGTHPTVGDWAAATNDDGYVRIPLQNPDGHAWFASLQMGTPLQYEQVCVVTNNHVHSMVFSKYCKNCPHKVYDHKYSSTYKSHYVNKTFVEDDGFIVEGGICEDYICLGQYGSRASIYKDPRTTVCMEHQAFFLVDRQLDWNWSAKATDEKMIDSICGLGQQQASPAAKGWLAKSVHEGKIKKNIYTIQLVPQQLAYKWPGSVPVTKYDEFEEKMLRTSFLTLGGYDLRDYRGDIVWFNTTAGSGWNQTLSGFKFGDEIITDSFSEVTAVFETGYPYIGLSEEYFDQVAEILQDEVHNIECKKGQHWGICRVPEQECSDISFNTDITMVIGEYQFSLPLDNMATYVNQSGTYYCQTQIALLAKSQQTIKLGGAFFSSFLGLFDVENGRIGFAESARALPGSSITCVGESCTAVSEVRHDPKTGNIPNAVIFTIIGSVLAGIAVCVALAVCKLKKRQNVPQQQVYVETEEDEIQPDVKRKRGYGLNEEKLDSDFEDECEEIPLDTEKPTF